MLVRVPARLADYFVVVGLDSSPTLADHNSNDRELNPLMVTFKASVQQHFPFEELKDTPIPNGLELFCLPDGLRLSLDNNLPIFFTFVLTGGDGERLYASCLTLWERLTPQQHQRIRRTFLRRQRRLRREASQELDRVPVRVDSDRIREMGMEEDEALNADLVIPVRNVSFDSEDVDTTSMQGGLSVTTPGNESPYKEDSSSGEEGDAEEDETDKRDAFLGREMARFPQVMYSPKCLVLLSHWPLYSTFKTFLTELYRFSISPGVLPLERYISNFMLEVPLPPAGRVEVQYAIGDVPISIIRTPVNQLPVADLPLKHVFQALNIENILLLMYCILTEQKILLCSQHISLLSIVSEGMLSLIFPFKWQHVYIPILPTHFQEFLTAPVPFIMGVVTDGSGPLQNTPDEVVVVDLDGDNIRLPQEVKYVGFGDKYRNKLLRTLRECIPQYQAHHPEIMLVDSAFPCPLPPEEMREVRPSRGKVKAPVEFCEQLTREHFLRFFVSMFQKYLTFLARPCDMTRNSEPDEVFRREAFIRDQPVSARLFLTKFTESQLFYKFLQDRINRYVRLQESKYNQSVYDPSGASPGGPSTAGNGKAAIVKHTTELGPNPLAEDYEIVFFDESINAKLNRSLFKLGKHETPFLRDIENKYSISKTFVPPAPDSRNLESLPRPVMYDSFPALNPNLVNPPRPVKRLVEEGSTDHIGQDTMASWKTLLNILAKLKRGKDPGILSKLGHSLRRSFIHEDPSHSEDELSIDVSSAGIADRSTSVGKNMLSTVPNEEPIKRIRFETENLCPKCTHRLSDSEVRQGWSWQPHDYCTTCPSCKHRFVSRFLVSLADNPHWNPDHHHEGGSPPGAAAASVNGGKNRSHTVSGARPTPANLHAKGLGASSTSASSGTDALDLPMRALSTTSITPSTNGALTPPPLNRERSQSGLAAGAGALAAAQRNSVANRKPPTTRMRNPGTVINCEYLNPILLKKEVENLLKKDVPCDENLFREHPTTFWNLIYCFLNINIPLPFLLPQVDWKAVVEHLSVDSSSDAGGSSSGVRSSSRPVTPSSSPSAHNSPDRVHRSPSVEASPSSPSSPSHAAVVRGDATADPAGESRSHRKEVSTSSGTDGLEEERSSMDLDTTLHLHRPIPKEGTTVATASPTSSTPSSPEEMESSPLPRTNSLRPAPVHPVSHSPTSIVEGADMDSSRSPDLPSPVPLRLHTSSSSSSTSTATQPLPKQ